jgi:iron complex outermembrane receptor protein
MKTRYLLTSAGFAIFVAQGCAAYAAQEAQAETTDAAPAAAVSRGLDDIVVTAQRRAQRLQDVPLTVSAATAEDLQRSGVTTVRDIQNIVSGFTFGGQGSGPQPAIRGVSSLVSPAGAENPVAAYIDGVYLPAPDVLNTELPDVARVEVLKGPQGTLFGRNATGGALQIFTREPEFTPALNLTIEPSYFTGSGGSHSSRRINARAFASVPLVPDVLAASISGGYSFTEGYFVNDKDGGQLGSIFRRNLRGKLLLTPSDTTKFLFTAALVQNNGLGGLLETPYKGMSAAAAFPGTIVPNRPWHAAIEDFVPNIGEDFFKHYMFSLRADFDFDVGTLTSLSAYQNNRKHTIFNPVHAAAATIPCLLAFACIEYDFVPRQRNYTQELNFASRDFGIFSFTTGLFYFDAKGGTRGRIQGGLASIAPAVFPLTVQDTQFSTKSIAGYGEGTIKASDALTIIVGARYSHDSLNDISLSPRSPRQKPKYNLFTPRVSVKYDIAEQLNVYATYSRGARNGLSGVGNTASVPQFAAVGPEKLTSYEAGLKYATGDLTFNGSFFYYDYKNKQEQTFLGTSTITKNTGPVRIYGFDFDTSARLTPDLQFNGSLSWIPTAKYRDFPDASGISTILGPNGYRPGIGNQVAACPVGAPAGCVSTGRSTFNATGFRLIRAPKVTASGTLSYIRDAFDMSATLNYSSAVLHDITGTIRQAPYVLLAAQAGYRFDERLRVGVFGRNLTNKAYIANGLTSGSGFATGWGPPREVGLTIGYTY